MTGNLKQPSNGDQSNMTRSP